MPSKTKPTKKSPAKSTKKTVSGGGGLKFAKRFNWKRAAPLIAVVALIGGYFAYKSLAYSAEECRQDVFGRYSYSEECVVDSDEAAIIRLYYGIFNRTPDSSGMTYWLNRLHGDVAPQLTLTQIAKQFMGTSEFRNRYGTLTNRQFVAAMYPQIFGRTPDDSGLTFWTQQLDSGKYTREKLITYFTQSTEMKTRFAPEVSSVLGFGPEHYSEKVKEYTTADLLCYGKRTTTEGAPTCQVYPDELSSSEKPDRVTAGFNLPSGSPTGHYSVCFESIRDIDTSASTIDPLDVTGTLYAYPNDKTLRNTMPLSDLLVTDSGGYGDWTYADGNAHQSCSHVTINSKTKSVILTDSTFLRSAIDEFKRYKGTTSLLTSKITLWRHKTPILSVREQAAGNMTRARFTQDVIFKGQPATIPRDIYFSRVTPTTSPLVFTPSLQTSIGPNTLTLPFWASSYGGKARVKVTLSDEATNQPIPITKLRVWDMDKGVLVDITGNEVLLGSGITTLDELEFTTPKALKVKVTVTVTSGSITGPDNIILSKGGLTPLNEML